MGLLHWNHGKPYICPRVTVCAEDWVALGLLGATRTLAYLCYPLLMLLFLGALMIRVRISDEGGLEIIIGKSQRCRLRVVPVLCAFNGKKRSQVAMPAEVTMHDDVKLVTVYLDVEHAPLGGSSDITKGDTNTYISWVAAKVALAMSEEYARTLAGAKDEKSKDIQLAIVGQMCVPDPGAVPDANQAKVASIDLVGQPLSRKRKAPGDDAN